MPKVLSKDKHQEIICYIKEGLSVRNIASKCNVGKSTVSEIRSQINLNNLVKSPGRPAKLSPQNKRLCIHSITSGKIKSAKQVQKNLLNDLNIEVSASTVCNALKEAGLGSIKKPTKPKLSKKNVKACLEFAKQHKHWTVADWKTVIWSDEAKINRFSSDGCVWAWIRDGEKLQSHHVKQVVKHSRGNIKIWGCITAYGVGFMCQIQQNLTKELYLEILNDELMNTISYYNLNASDIIFQHDNDPKHTAKVA